MTARLEEKALDILRFAALPVGSVQRVEAIERAAEKWSWRAIDRKTQELADRGYVEHLLSGCACGSITDKGRAALQIAANAASPAKSTPSAS